MKTIKTIINAMASRWRNCATQQENQGTDLKRASDPRERYQSGINGYSGFQ